MKRILFVDHAREIGGAEQSLLFLMTFLDQAKWQPHLATANGRLAQSAQKQNIPTHLIEFPRLRRSTSWWHNWWQTSKNLAQMSQEIGAELIYANTVRAAIFAALAGRLARRPFIWHMRDFWLSESKPDQIWFDTLLKKIICRQAAQIIANSHAVSNHLPCPDKVNVVHNGIDASSFNPEMDGAPFKAEFDIPVGTPLVGMVGRLRPWKGQKTFLLMANRLLRLNPDCYFVIVGGATFGLQDDYPQQLQQAAQELGLSERVTFTGAMADVRPALAAMDVFVHPGEPEPFGLVNIEAMAMAKPVVAFNHGALPEIVVDGETGLLINPFNEVGLAQAAASLVANPHKSIQMGYNGRRRVETHFTIQHTTEAVSHILDRII